MGDSINIDWSRAGQVPDMANAFATGFENARKMSLQKEADHARQDALANPSDMNALTKFAVYDPDGAKSIMGMLDYQRAGQARQAAGNVISAYGTPGFAQAPAAMPVPAPQAAPQPAIAASGALPPVAPGTSFQNAFAAVGAPQAQPGQAPAAPQAGPQAQPSPITDPTHPAAQQVGAAALSGQVDPMQAWARLYSLDPVMGDKMVAAIGSMDKLRLDRLNEMNGSLGSAAQTLLGMPQEQRAAAFQQMVPMLQQHGVTLQAMQQALQAGLSDSFLHGVVGQIVGTTGLIEQANKDRDFGLKSTTELGRLAVDQANSVETGRHNRVEEGKGVQDGFGNVVNPISGQVIYSATGGGDTFSRMIGVESGGNQLTAGGKPVTSPKGAVGIAQVMPGTAPEAARLAGVEWDPVKYKTDANYNATIGRAYYNNLLQKFGGDETKAVAAYNGGIGRVQKAVASSGANWLQQMPAETRAYVAKVGSGGGAGGMTGDAIEMAAREGLAHGGVVPQGYARNKGAQAAITNRMAQIAQSEGKTVGDYIAGGAANKADASSLVALEKQATIIRSAETTAEANAHLALSLMPAVANGNITVFNGWKNHWNTMSGHPAVAKFAAALSTFSNEYATVMGRGQSTDSLRSEAHSMINTSQSPQQLQGVIQTMQQDMRNRRAGFDSERAATLGRISGKPQPTSHVASNTPPAVTAVLRKYGIN